MEAWLITAVKELASCLISLWRKLAYDLAEDKHTPSEHNIRNMFAVKMAYQLNVRCDLCLWNVVENSLLVLRTAFSLEDSDVLKKDWHRYTQTHINTDTHKDKPTHTLIHTLRHTDTQTHTNTTGIYTQRYRHTSTQDHTQQTHKCTHSLSCNTHTHTHTLPTNIDHHTT